MQAFRIKVVPSEQGCILVLSGEADLAVADDIVQLGTLSLNDPTSRILVVDLHEVSFIDSTALGALVQLRNVAHDSGQELRLARVPARVQRVMEIAGLDAVFGLPANDTESRDGPDGIGPNVGGEWATAGPTS